MIVFGFGGCAAAGVVIIITICRGVGVGERVFVQ